MSSIGAAALGILCAAMPAPHPGIFADFWSSNDAWISAALSILVAAAIAFALDRMFRTRLLRAAVARTSISAAADTRLRFVRRLIYAAILLIGVAVALSQFTGVNRLAASLLASGAIAAAIVGFAARQVLANFVAGIMLAITQPLRVGDWISFEDTTGIVEEIRLNYTMLRTLGGARIIVPNEKLASTVLRNDTLATDEVGVEVTIWLAPEVDVERAIKALADESGGAVSVAEVQPWGVRLSVDGGRVAPPQRPDREADLRRRCVARLRSLPR